MVIFGYGFGSLGMGAAYYFMSAYFVVFLTNCVGLNSAIATTISAVALLVEVAAGMVVGNISDRCGAEMGRRRPFILASSIAMVPILTLILHDIKASDIVTVLYYIVLAILFRVFFSSCEIPYNALGAEIAEGYDDRTRLRTVSRVFSIVGNAMGYIMPLIILDMFAGMESYGWQIIGIILAATCLVSWLVTVFTAKEKTYMGGEHSSERKNVIREIAFNYKELIKLKTMKLLIIYKAAFSCAFSLFNVGTLYFLQYNLGLDNRYSSYIYIFTITIFVVFTPAIDKLAMIKNKAWQQMTSMALCGVSGILIYVFAADSVVGCALYIGLFAVVQTGFWQLSGSLFYDVVEVDEYVNYKNRQGDIMSLVSVLGTLITAIMVQLFGIFFNAVGFDPTSTIQPQGVTSFLNAAYILFPCLCLMVGAWALKVFPINKETFASLQSALALRKEGKPYDEYMEDIEKIVG